MIEPDKRGNQVNIALVAMAVVLYLLAKGGVL